MSEKNYISPQFIIIGAMKSATTTLYEQLLAQPGIFLPALKEPNYFSDDEQFSKGAEWYSSLFADADAGDLIGEASTHYTKLPTYPETLPRMKKALESPRFIYVMRHPVDRLVSHYIHEWTQGNISVDINRAISKHPELIAYSKYSYQLNAFFEVYPQESILPVFFESIRGEPQAVLNKVSDFIGYKQVPKWQEDIKSSNVSKERIRKFPLYGLIVDSALGTFLRQKLVPVAVREKIKRRFQMRKRPELNEESLAILHKAFDEDLAVLGSWLGLELNCQNFKTVASKSTINWKK